MNERTPYIEFEHVHKAFGSKVVINDLSFDVMPGETVCILGRSGVGKSVSLQMIMGFLKADSGQVRVANEDVTNYGEAEMELIRKKVTMPSEVAIISMASIMDNVRQAEDWNVELETSQDDPLLGESYVKFAWKGLQHQLSQGAGGWTLSEGRRTSYYKLIDSDLPETPVSNTHGGRQLRPGCRNPRRKVSRRFGRRS